MEISEFLQKAKPTATSIELDNKGIVRLESLIELLKRFQQLKRLSLKNNKLKYLPQSIGDLVSLEELDISGNPLESLADMVGQLEKLINLKKLNVSISSFEDEHLITLHLPQLQFLNKQKVEPIPVAVPEPVVVQSEPIPPINFEFFTQQNVEEATGAFQDLRDLLSENNFGSQDEMQHLFETQLIKIINDTREKYAQETDKGLQTLAQLKQKYTLYELCFQRAIEFAEKVDERLFESLAVIHDSHALIFKQMSKLIQDQSVALAEKLTKFDPTFDISAERVKALEDQMEALQNENKQYLQKIIRLSKGENILRDSTSYKLNKGVNENFNFNNSNINQQYPTSPSKIGITNTKQLTLNQLKEVINEIYTSKEQFDTKDQKKQNLPPQTMEMHMYEFLTQKYGLKSIVIEQASTIVHAVRRLTGEDNDVAVFTKILKNECDENFRFAQAQLKKTIKELLVMHLKGKYPLKNSVEIKTMIDQRTNGTISLEESSDIVGYMYNKDDSSHIMQQLRDKMDVMMVPSSPVNKQSQQKGQKRDDLKDQNEKKKLQYTAFEKVVLDFQLRSHEKFLRPFINLFKRFDLDIDGVLSEEEFRSLVASINIPMEPHEVERLLAVIDPFTMQQVTFSQVVNLFSEETVIVQNSAMSILQHLSFSQAPPQQQQLQLPQ